MIDRVDKRLVFKPLNNRPFLHGETEPCINGRILAIGSYFSEPNDAMANQLLGEQLEDGGWNCEARPFFSPKRPQSRRSSFHTTICVLEGLLEYERAVHKSVAVNRARKRAENYLLDRRMFRSLRTGEVIDKRWLRFSYPTFWHYDILRGRDYDQPARRDGGGPVSCAAPLPDAAGLRPCDVVLSEDNPSLKVGARIIASTGCPRGREGLRKGNNTRSQRTSVVPAGHICRARR